MIPWNSPTFGRREEVLVDHVLRSGYVSEGLVTKELEEELAKIVGTKHIILTTSATSALYMAIEADKRIRGYTQGTVAIPSLTFVATKNAVELANLTPEYYDVDKDRFTLDPTQEEKSKSKIIIPVNLLGRAFDNVLGDFSSNEITFICDNAGALGSEVPNGKVGCYSLQANKLINCGQGGFCATNDDTYAKVMKEIKDFGRQDKDDNNTVGFNFKFNDILAAVALGQLSTFKERVKHQVDQYNLYKICLSDYGKFVEFKENEVPLWIEFIVPNGKRDNLKAYLTSKGIYSRPPWKPFVSLPNSDFYYNNVLWLPCGFSLKEDTQKEVIKAIQEYFNGN